MRKKASKDAVVRSRRGAPMLHIGASKEAMAEARRSIMEILVVQQDPTVLVEALKTLSTLASVNGTTVRDCVFTG